ncbi:MAG: RdgB/HAM1 family non-canonical purine NTP pyrophosphatase [Steroidobacteraceae bacterium]
MRERLPPRLVLATGNAGKIRELAALLEPHGVEVLPQSHYTATGADETGDTFVENAILKARHAAAASGLPAIADDSGLEVDALGGAPGVRSARYAGEGASDQANNARLLAELEGVPAARRTARYRCAIVYVRSADDPAPLIREASWEGAIETGPRGHGGFGYDPLFRVAGDVRTAAEYPAAEKNRVSHRGQALAALVGALAGPGR